MSVEFSGHRMKSGCATCPSRALTVRLTVSARWLLVTVRARPSASTPRPGTLPCTMPTFTGGWVAAGIRLLQLVEPKPQARQDQHERDGDRGVSARNRPGRAEAEPDDAVRDELSDQRDQEGDTGDANDRIEAGQRCVDRRERQLPPAEPAERDPSVRELDQRPAARRGQRPPPQHRHQVEGQTQQGEEERLERDQQHGDPDAEDVDPADRDAQHGEAVDVAETERTTAPDPAHDQGERRQADSRSGQSPYGCQLRPVNTPATSATA